MYTKAGIKEKLLILLILAFVIFLGFLELPKKEPIKTTEIKKVEKKKTTPLHPKKEKFLKLLLPTITKVYNELNIQYETTKKLIETDPTNPNLEELKISHEVNSNEELLIALKPHPISITLAQAAIESAWGTSRFFNEANNIFGVWSFNENEPRIAASVKREDKTIYLKKFSSLEEAIRQYYDMLSSKKIYFEFKKENYISNDSIEIAKKLTSYSEQGEEYTRKVISVIKFNKFTQFDEIN